MSDAFKCDFCEEFKDGAPAEELFRKEHIDRQGTDVVHVADVCGSCWNQLDPRSQGSEDDE